jgi:hypothetical protein
MAKLVFDGFLACGKAKLLLLIKPGLRQIISRLLEYFDVVKNATGLAMCFGHLGLLFLLKGSSVLNVTQRGLVPFLLDFNAPK